MKGAHDMSLEKIRWWGKAQKKIKNGAWYYPIIQRVVVFENRVIEGWKNTITETRQKNQITYELSQLSYAENKDDYNNAADKTKQTLQRCKNLGYNVTTLTFDQFY